MNSVGTFVFEFSAGEKKLSDESVLEKVRAGETKYFEILIRRYNQRLYRIARGYLNDDSMVEDVMQDSYIKAYEKIDQFEGRAKFSTWLTRILINTALAKINQSKRFSTININELLDDEQGFQFLIEEQNHEHEMVRKNISSLIETAIDKLPEKYRLVFMMRVVEGISMNDTAECLSISEDNVKVRLFRAKKILKNYLKETMADLDLFNFYLDRCDRITKSVLVRIGVL